MLRDALSGLGSVIKLSLRVLGRHWPELVGLFLAGWIGHMGFMWLSIAVMRFSPTLSVLILPLAPMSTLLSLVLMVRAIGESLPAFGDLFAGATPRQRWTGDLAVAAQVLLPFLALYVSQGMLKADARMYLVESNTEMYLHYSEWTKAAEYANGPFLAVMVIVAIVARKLIGVFELTKKSTAWAFAATFLEILWVFTLANVFDNQLDAMTDWVTSRAIIAQIIDWWNGLHTGGGTNPVTAILTAIGKVLKQAGNLIIVPVSWLALGATVYGAKLTKRDEFGKIEIPGDHDEVTQKLKKIPSPVRRYAAQTVEPITTPIKDTVTALGKVATAGVLPMVGFCLIFVFIAQVKLGVAWAYHAITGAGPIWYRWAYAPFADMAANLLYFVLALPLLGAAVNFIVLGDRAEAETKAHMEASDQAAADALATDATSGTPATA